jgi:hypothetical protein
MRAGWTIFDLLAIVILGVAAYYFPVVLTVCQWLLLILFTISFTFAIIGLIFARRAKFRRRRITPKENSQD